MHKHEKDIKRFDVWFADNYVELTKHCKRYRIEEDLLQDVYVNIHDRIVRSGYTESFFATYVKRSLRNLWINEAKKCNGKNFIDADCEEYQTTIENALQLADDMDKDSQQYIDDVMYFSRMMFEYINYKQYSQEWQTCFRMYYLMPNRFTYTKLTIMSGYNKNFLTKVITTIKSDIRNNFIDWLKNNKENND